MTSSLKVPRKCGRIICSKLKTLLGTLICYLFAVFVILSIPVYLFRVLATKLAKRYRPDFGDILNGQSGIFVNDYFEKTTPRANIVCILHCEGVITFKEIKKRVVNGLIRARDSSTGELLYEKLQHYPIKWLGFAFWKKALNTFSIDNHVYKHSGMETLDPCTEVKLTNLVEKLLNTPFSPKKSPWEFHVIENYLYKEVTINQNQMQKGEQHSTVVFRFHHCLADGTGVLKSLLEGLLQNYTVDAVKRPSVREIKRSLLKRFWFWLSFPVNLIVELSYLFSLNFRSNPWKVPDNIKKWKQVYAKTELIAIDLLKEIKNTFGVSFTSVLLSVISGAVEKSIKGKNTPKGSGTSAFWPFASMLPVLGGSSTSRGTLENHFSAVCLDIPITNFRSPLERLESVHDALENSRYSVAPFMFQMFTTLMGAHLLSVSRVLMKNRQVPIVLTNFAATPENALILSKYSKIIHIDAVVGGMSGELGVVLATVSHNGNLRINITAEEALMTSSKVEQFADYINEEIENLRELMLMKKSIKLRNSN